MAESLHKFEEMLNGLNGSSLRMCFLRIDLNKARVLFIAQVNPGPLTVGVEVVHNYVRLPQPNIQIGKHDF